MRPSFRPHVHPHLLPKLWDLDLSNVKATPHVEPRTASLLPPITLEDVHPPAQSPGTYPPGRIPSRELTTSRLIPIYDLFESYIDGLASTTPTTQYHKVPYFYLTSLRLGDLSGPPGNPPQGSPLFAPATTRSFLSSVAAPVAPFELQPAPSTLQHKPSYTQSYLKAYSDPGLTGLEEEDKDNIICKAQERVERVRARKAAAAAKKAAEEQAARAAAAREKEAREQAHRACQQEEEVVELRRRRLPEPVGGDPDDGDDGDDDDDDEEDRAPCERCKAKKLPCQMQAGKRGSIICKPCHNAKVRCSYSGRPTTSKQREGSSGERIAVMESQMAQSLADLRALWEADSKTHQYLCQLLRRQEDDHARLIAMEMRMAMMGMGEGPAMAGPPSSGDH
ncbi:hypothetical protein F5051DRAFT_446458 [Lentinula edodes]|nr:hypothetical protein F5051DRAFT_446458 [Lentinula edodes]